jgi:hypothetical protein
VPQNHPRCPGVGDTNAIPHTGAPGWTYVAKEMNCSCFPFVTSRSEIVVQSLLAFPSGPAVRTEDREIFPARMSRKINLKYRQRFPSLPFRFMPTMTGPSTVPINFQRAPKYSSFCFSKRSVCSWSGSAAQRLARACGFIGGLGFSDCPRSMS